MTPIAITGIASILPGSRRFRDAWRDILAQKTMMKPIPEEYWSIKDYYDSDPTVPDKTYVNTGAFLDLIDFAPMAFGVPPKVLPETDTSQLLGLIVASEVLKDAFGAQYPKNISVILGATAGTKLFYEAAQRTAHAQIRKALNKAGIEKSKTEEVLTHYASQFVSWEEQTFPGLLPNVISGRITNRLDLDGENCTVDAACASAFGALKNGVNKLITGEADIVMTGGVDTLNGPPMYMCFSKTPAMSPTQVCRPFSKDADGTMLGEALVMFIIKRLEQAEKDGDKIYAVIKGIGASSDGKQKSIYAPAPKGQIKAITRCYEHADYAPETVTLLEAHGTGTKAGDSSEIEALKSVFTGASTPCALGSIKAQYGHTKACAGALGLFKAVLALNNKVIPATMNCDNPIDLDGSAFYINTQNKPWINTNSHPRRAGVSSFGFGGTNYHITLEEYHGRRKINALTHNILAFSAQTKDELDSHIERVKQELESAYIVSEMLDKQIFLLSKSFDPSAPFKKVFVVSLPSLFDDATVFTHNDQPMSNNIYFDVPSDLDLTDLACTFDVVRQALENGKAPKQAIDNLFMQFNIKEASQKDHAIDCKGLTTQSFILILANLLSKGMGVLTLDEFDLDYDHIEKPGFSVKIAGYNYGKPKINI